MRAKLIKESINNFPSIEEIFDTQEENYNFNTYDEMNNIQSMTYFLEMCGIDDEFIQLDDGTMVILEHPNYDYLIRLDSGGRGDFYSHVIKSSIDTY